MKELRALTEQEWERAAYALMNPRSGSKIAEARDYGVDLTLLVEQLRKTPAERANIAESVALELGPIRGILRKRR